MIFRKPLGSNGMVIIMVSGKAGHESNSLPPEKGMDLLTIWRHLVDLGSHFGAHWILKGSQNWQYSYKINIKLEKRVCRNVSWKNMILGCMFGVTMGGLEKPKQAFRHILVAKYEFSGNCEVQRKSMPKDVPTTIKINHFGEHRVDLFEML